MMITEKVWMNADTLVVFSTLEVFGVGAGNAAIARILAGLGTPVRVPVVTGAVVYRVRL